MNYNFQKFTYYGLMILLIVIALGAMYGCNGSSSPINPISVNNYYIKGFIVENPNIDKAGVDSTQIVLSLKRNDTVLSTAQIKFNNQTLSFNNPLFALDSVYSFSDFPTPLLSPQTYEIVINDSLNYLDTINTIITDTFSIIQVFPEQRILTPYHYANISWNSASNVEGYVIAATLRDSIYTGFGFSAYVTSQTNSATYPLEAFRQSNLDVPDTGWYYLYVYGYTGVPDSALSEKFLPVRFPTQLLDNINFDHLKGHLGSIVVSKKDSIRIVLQ
ncbi:MAG: hypothetical protein GXO93_03435 [FCB group bacterium]|nr:hypothetical protein [FCB group bacterium]